MKAKKILDLEMEKVYTIILVLSLIVFVLLYVLNFTSFNQEALLLYAPFWLLPLTFSSIGLVIEKFGNKFKFPHAEGSLRIAFIATVITGLLFWVLENLLFKLS